MPLPGPARAVGHPCCFRSNQVGRMNIQGYAGDRAVGERLERRFPGKPVTKPVPIWDGRLEVRLSHAQPPLPSGPSVTEVGRLAVLRMFMARFRIEQAAINLVSARV